MVSLNFFLCMFLFSFVFCYIIAFPTWLSFCVCTRWLGCITPTPDSLSVDKHHPLSAVPPITIYGELSGHWRRFCEDGLLS